MTERILTKEAYQAETRLRKMRSDMQYAIPPGALPTNADDERMVAARVNEVMAQRERIAELLKGGT